MRISATFAIHQGDRAVDVAVMASAGPARTLTAQVRSGEFLLIGEAAAVEDFLKDALERVRSARRQASALEERDELGDLQIAAGGVFDPDWAPQHDHSAAEDAAARVEKRANA